MANGPDDTASTATLKGAATCPRLVHAPEVQASWSRTIPSSCVFHITPHAWREGYTNRRVCVGLPTHRAVRQLELELECAFGRKGRSAGCALRATTHVNALLCTPFAEKGLSGTTRCCRMNGSR